MKLIATHNRINIFFIVIVLFITGFVYYQAISWILTRQNDKSLQDEETALFEYVNQNNSLPQIFTAKYQQMIFTKIAAGEVQRRLIDTVYFKKWGKNNPKRKKYKRDGNYEPGRGLITNVIVRGQYYKVLIIQSKAETEDLITIILYITLSVILLLLLILLVSNRLILNRLWQPFYTIMKELEMFSITDTKELTNIQSPIDEFQYLNKAVAKMEAKAIADYKALKTFTENASHELLTPIASINSKLDSLVQTDKFTEKQSLLLGDLYTGISRLSRLSQSLLLLVKIENQLLNNASEINLKLLIEEILKPFEVILRDRKLKLTCDLVDKQITADRYLVEILINNLVVNAIRHNSPGGKIDICLTTQKLIIRNTGSNRPLPGDEIFARFYKSPGSEGSGLGLTISRQICENFKFSLNYTFDLPYHEFTVSFENAEQ